MRVDHFIIVPESLWSPLPTARSSALGLHRCLSAMPPAPSAKAFGRPAAPQLPHLEK
jgi:hypothetical protein